MRALALSSDATRAVGANLYRNVSIWDLSPFVSPPSSTEPTSDSDHDKPSTQPMSVYKAEPSYGRIIRMEFSADGRGILTNEGYVPLKAREHWPLAAQRKEQERIDAGRSNALTPLSHYFLKDGWIWRAYRDGKHRRMCWVPPSWRDQSPGVSYLGLWGNVAFTPDHRAIFWVHGKGPVVIDMSACE